MLCPDVHLYVHVSDFGSTFRGNQKNTQFSFLCQMHVVNRMFIDISFCNQKSKNTRQPTSVLCTEQLFFQLLLTFMFLQTPLSARHYTITRKKHIPSQRVYDLSGQGKTRNVTVTFPISPVKQKNRNKNETQSS